MMPAKYRYKTEEAYQAQLAIDLKRQREKRYSAAMMVITDISAKCREPIPEMDEEYSEQYTVTMRAKEANKRASMLRRHLIRRFNGEFKQDVIVVVGANCHPKTGFLYYTVELTAYGASLRKDWLVKEIMDYGLEIVGYIPKGLNK